MDYHKKDMIPESIEHYVDLKILDTSRQLENKYGSSEVEKPYSEIIKEARKKALLDIMKN